MKHPPPISRRHFIQSASLLGLSTSLVGQRLPGQNSANLAAWPVSCRDIHLPKTGQPDSWSAMKDLGIKGVEVRVSDDLTCASLYHPTHRYSLASPDHIQQLQEELRTRGFQITAFCMNNRLDERLETELAWTRKLLPAMTPFNVEVVRIDVVPHRLPPAEFLPFAIQACRKLCELAQDTPVRFAIENHGSLTNNPDFLERLFDGVASDRLGLTLDPNNLYWFGHPLRDVYPIIEKFAARVFHTHCKNISYPEAKRQERRPMGWEYDQYACPLEAGDIDYVKIARLLHHARYRGDLCLEIECLHRFPASQHPDILKKEIQFLTRLSRADLG